MMKAMTWTTRGFVITAALAFQLGVYIFLVRSHVFRPPCAVLIKINRFKKRQRTHILYSLGLIITVLMT